MKQIIPPNASSQNRVCSKWNLAEAFCDELDAASEKDTKVSNMRQISKCFAPRHLDIAIKITGEIK